MPYGVNTHMILAMAHRRDVAIRPGGYSNGGTAVRGIGGAMIITLSRQAGTNGTLIGALVAERLDYRLYDRELVDEIARRLNLTPAVVAQIDEAQLNPVESIILEWRSALNEDVYARYLREALEHIANRGNAVIIGRGANFALQRRDALHVRIVAPLALRMAIYGAMHEMPEGDARRRLQGQDDARATFVRRLYHMDIADPVAYDLVVNLARFTPEQAAEEIVTAARLRAAQPVSLEVAANLPQHLAELQRHRRPMRPNMVERERRAG